LPSRWLFIAATPSINSPKISRLVIAEATRARHQVSRLGIAGKLVLQCPVSLVVEILRKVAGKCRTFDEFHLIHHTPLAYDCIEQDSAPMNRRATFYFRGTSAREKCDPFAVRRASSEGRRYKGERLSPRGRTPSGPTPAPDSRVPCPVSRMPCPEPRIPNP
jgi:hypothetical protein